MLTVVEMIRALRNPIPSLPKNYSSEFCPLELTQKFSIDAKPGEITLLSGSPERVGKEHQPLNHWVPLDAQAKSHNLPVSLQAKRSNQHKAATTSTSWPLLPLRDRKVTSQDRSLKPCKHYLPSGQQEVVGMKQHDHPTVEESPL